MKNIIDEKSAGTEAVNWKKLVIGLAAASVLSLSVGHALFSGSHGMENSALQTFLKSAKAQVVHVFDRSAWEQRAID